MNPILVRQLDEIVGAVEQLRVEFDHAHSQVEFLTRSKEELQRKFWSQSKELRILQEHMEALGSLKQDSEKLKEIKAEFEQRLRDILRVTRALTAEFKK